MDVMKALDRPMVEWEAMYDALGSEREIAALVDDAAALAIRAARLAQYVTARNHGDRHDQAVRAQNTAAGKVRIALGFTRRRNDIHF